MIQRRSGVVPLFLIDDVDSTQLEAHHFQYESIIPARTYVGKTTREYDDYVNQCVVGLTFRYQTDNVVLLNRESTVDRLERQLQGLGHK
jgi:hypothetical protein